MNTYESWPYHLQQVGLSERMGQTLKVWLSLHLLHVHDCCADPKVGTGCVSSRDEQPAI
jgi:hypothetical protein